MTSEASFTVTLGLKDQTEYRLSQGQIRMQTGADTRTADLSAVVEVRLIEFDNTGITELHFANDKSFGISSGDASVEGNSAADYVEFLRTLHSALADSGQVVRFRSGSWLLFWIALIFGTGLIAATVLLYLDLLPLPAGTVVPVPIVLVILVPIALPFALLRLRPKSYDPAALPDTMLPH